MDGSGSSDLSFLYDMLNLGFDGYASEISQVVDRTFRESPRTAVSVREILTPRTPGLHADREISRSSDDMDVSQKSQRSVRREHSDTPITPRRLGSQPVSVVYHTAVKQAPGNSLSLSSGSSWPELNSMEHENLQRQLHNHLRQQQQRRFSDLGMSPITPRSGSTDLPPYHSARTSSNTPRALASIKEHSGSNLSLDELRNFKLYERSLPHPSPKPLHKSSSFKEPKAGYGLSNMSNHGGFVPGPAFDNLASLTASGPGVRRENGVHVPYLDIPVTGRSNSMKTQELLSALLSGYQTSSTNASSTLYNSQNTNFYPDRALEPRGSLASQGLPVSDNLEAKPGPPEQPGEPWTRRDKMLLAGLICVALIVILLAVIVLLVAAGVVKDDGDSSTSVSSGEVNAIYNLIKICYHRWI
ncbi:hypothetical protein ElyMa_003716700 [Elysia marginata]|uniref:LEM domain-containing protein n=1 Tax=Elysia marginata TaxID=1093978 RepID=A0AAV4F4B7_9GAST|nr:hypothetical protein ElyMa_003716700 [Elysia marginata]